jgi:ATP-dependent exoDNAse (exonuclease V) alpha subunit
MQSTCSDSTDVMSFPTLNLSAYITAATANKLETVLKMKKQENPLLAAHSMQAYVSISIHRSSLNKTL